MTPGILADVAGRKDGQKNASGQGRPTKEAHEKKVRIVLYVDPPDEPRVFEALKAAGIEIKQRKRKPKSALAEEQPVIPTTPYPSVEEHE